MHKAKETVLEIDLKALEHNYHYLRSRIHPETKFLGVVKAFAYGSDAATVAFKLEQLGVDYFAVAYVTEGVTLRNEGVTKPILVLHPIAANFETLIHNRLEPSIYSPYILSQFTETAQKMGVKNYPIHIKFNTGLNRLGFTENDITYLGEQLLRQDQLKVVSILSHLAASEDYSEAEFTKKQISSFDKIVSQFSEVFKYRPICHILNTSGILNYPEAQYDMVRSGIGLYGYGNEAKFDAQLKPIATLKTIISQLHRLGPNQSIGYNRGHITQENTVTATLPIGHADGIGRQYGKGKTYVMLHGKMVPIIGNVCMDMIMIDVTGIECKEGDEVIIFGPQLSAQAVAETANTISYELLTGISQRVKRTYID